MDKEDEDVDVEDEDSEDDEIEDELLDDEAIELVVWVRWEDGDIDDLQPAAVELCQGDSIPNAWS